MQSFISSQSKPSIKSKIFVEKCLKLTNLNKDKEKKHYEVICPHILILSQSKLSIKTNHFFDRRFKAHQTK